MTDRTETIVDDVINDPRVQAWVQDSLRIKQIAMWRRTLRDFCWFMVGMVVAGVACWWIIASACHG